MASKSVENNTTRDSAALSEICCLHCEMEAIADALMSTIDGIDIESQADQKKASRAYALTLALQRSIQEVGRQAGAI